MKRELAIVSFAVAGFMASATTTWAIPYVFTFSGADVMEYKLSSAADGTTPADINLNDGARRYTFDTDNGGTGSWSSWLKTTRNMFDDWADTTKSRLTMFNLWGFGDIQTQYGDSNVTAWGEQFTIASWDDNGAANKNWASVIYSDDDTLGKDVLTFYSKTGYADALKFDAKGPTFSFTLDLDPDTTPWLNDKDGRLVFWFGGVMANKNDDYMGIFQGNMVLKGVAAPVPEPTTILLFGAGLAGLAAVGRKSRKSNS